VGVKFLERPGACHNQDIRIDPSGLGTFYPYNHQKQLYQGDVPQEFTFVDKQLDCNEEEI
jgi:hypothetical protein